VPWENFYRITGFGLSYWVFSSGCTLRGWAVVGMEGTGGEMRRRNVTRAEAISISVSKSNVSRTDGNPKKD
jgi:hypothetical protein